MFRSDLTLSEAFEDLKDRINDLCTAIVKAWKPIHTVIVCCFFVAVLQLDIRSPTDKKIEDLQRQIDRHERWLRWDSHADEFDKWDKKG